MFLSKCELNAARKGTHRLLASPHMMHAAVEASFPSGAPVVDNNESVSAGRILWRVDPGVHNPILYVVSPAAPDFTHIVEQAGWPTQPQWGVANYSGLLENLKPGQLWQFRLAANPVHNERGLEGTRGKRYAHVTVAQQEKWLMDRAERLGVSFDWETSPSDSSANAGSTFRVAERKVMSFQRGKRKVTVRKVRYDGTLRVVDPQRLREALLSGVGAAKAYGCGLLTIAPVLRPVSS